MLKQHKPESHAHTRSCFFANRYLKYILSKNLYFSKQNLITKSSLLSKYLRQYATEFHELPVRHASSVPHFIENHSDPYAVPRKAAVSPAHRPRPEPERTAVPLSILRQYRCTVVPEEAFAAGRTREGYCASIPPSRIRITRVKYGSSLSSCVTIRMVCPPACSSDSSVITSFPVAESSDPVHSPPASTLRCRVYEVQETSAHIWRIQETRHRQAVA